MQAKGLAPDGPGKAHRRRRRVLLVIGVQDEDAVHGARQDRVRPPVFRRHRERHPQEVLGIGKIVAGGHEDGWPMEYLKARAAIVGILAISL